MSKTTSFISYCFLFAIIVLGISCQDHSPLDRIFNIDQYNKDVSLKLYNSKEIDQYDWFILNYTIKRQKAVFGYDVAGKTYREILEMGREFKENGLPVPTTFNYNGNQDIISQQVKNIETSTRRKKGNSKTLKKVLNFSCRYTNTSDRAVGLENSTFQLFGPFKDHVVSLGYEVNCLIKAGETITINYIVDAKELINSLRFKENYYVKSMGLEDFFLSVDIQPSGNSVNKNARQFDTCKFGSARIDPFKIFDYYNDIDYRKSAIRGADGKIVEFHLGDAHYEINDAQEVTNMDRIGKGKLE